LQSCGGSATGSNCQARQSARQERRQMRGQSDCGCNDPGHAMESYEMPAGDCGCGCSAAPATTAPVESCGCTECASVGQSTGGLLGRVSDNRMAKHGSDFVNVPEATAEQTCSSGTCNLEKRRGSRGNDVRPCGGQVLGGRVAQAGGHFADGHFAGGGLGCGHKGCGTRGQICSNCRLRSRFARGHFRGGPLGGHYAAPYAGAIPHSTAPPTFNGGPGLGGVPQYVYPYYTTRGPRDFLMSKPPSIGP